MRWRWHRFWESNRRLTLRFLGIFSGFFEDFFEDSSGLLRILWGFPKILARSLNIQGFLRDSLRIFLKILRDFSRFFGIFKDSLGILQDSCKIFEHSGILKGFFEDFSEDPSGFFKIFRDF